MSPARQSPLLSAREGRSFLGRRGAPARLHEDPFLSRGGAGTPKGRVLHSPTLRNGVSDAKSKRRAQREDVKTDSLIKCVYERNIPPCCGSSTCGRHVERAIRSTSITRARAPRPVGAGELAVHLDVAVQQWGDDTAQRAAGGQKRKRAAFLRRPRQQTSSGGSKQWGQQAVARGGPLAIHAYLRFTTAERQEQHPEGELQYYHLAPDETTYSSEATGLSSR